METVTHPIPPLFDASSRILILGSFPSSNPREGLFFYHIPRQFLEGTGRSPWRTGARLH